MLTALPLAITTPRPIFGEPYSDPLPGPSDQQLVGYLVQLAGVWIE
jgi:hypothetical protein